ncbi:hypothetical protein QJS10_CPA09g01240 [Acorus calamus]|uniref:DUF4283 domain-containing protein n=1 Tax=Acorus calamus TaxID=4465 RepID=A0AAV9E4S4_ACOCL|nr:hypothetical protein QJS10_CPA09g01240 [Acorus calamus]
MRCSRASNARICVEIQAAHALPDSVLVDVSPGVRESFKVDYDWKHLACKFCQTFGHDEACCIMKPVIAKQVVGKVVQGNKVSNTTPSLKGKEKIAQQWQEVQKSSNTSKGKLLSDAMKPSPSTFKKGKMAEPTSSNQFAALQDSSLPELPIIVETQGGSGSGEKKQSEVETLPSVATVLQDQSEGASVTIIEGSLFVDLTPASNEISQVVSQKHAERTTSESLPEAGSNIEAKRLGSNQNKQSSQVRKSNVNGPKKGKPHRCDPIKDFFVILKMTTPQMVKSTKTLLLVPLTRGLGYPPKKGSPWIVGGDFNVVWYSNEKSGGRPIHARRLRNFNSCIEASGLQDLKACGHTLSWSNRQETRIMCRLDRVMGSQSEEPFPKTGVLSPKRLNRSKSSLEETSDLEDADGSPLPSLREHQHMMPRLLQTPNKGIRRCKECFTTPLTDLGTLRVLDLPPQRRNTTGGFIPENMS